MLTPTYLSISQHKFAYFQFGPQTDASQEPLKLANEPITRNMARRYQAKLNLWAQEEVTRRIQDQSSMLMEDELKESTKFINILEVIMENREERPNFEIHLSLA